MYPDGYLDNDFLLYPAIGLFLLFLDETDLNQLNGSEREAVDRVKDQLKTKKELRNFIRGLRA